jgi:hypothetical protein
MDGALRDGAWAAAPWTEDFVDIHDGPAPRLRTRAKMLWDDECLYIGAELEEPDLWATYTEHDSVIFHENDFEVFLDPDGDCHNYFEYEINTLGTDWDLFLPKPYRFGGSARNEWEAEGLRKAVVLRGTLNDPRDRDDGWTLELALPWRCLRFGPYAAQPPAVGSSWRVNFSRVEWDLEHKDGAYRKTEGRGEHNWVWSPQGVVDMHRPEMWGYLQFEAEADAAPRQDPDWDDRAACALACQAWRDGEAPTGAAEVRGDDGARWFCSGRVAMRDDSLVVLKA